MPIREFIRGPGTVALDAGEILAGVRLRKAPHWNIHHYEKVGRRKAQACAVASMAEITAMYAPTGMSTSTVRAPALTPIGVALL